ncbi:MULTISPECIES: phage holin family protein [Pseudomonas]|uniref:Phage holin family protein n=1 Tax=Pseudomonas quercus TaxID=2722792 RepID=A0ABX0Y8M9_9PSED|nr:MULTISPECIES: phage holin family protein [Pseudomonas]MBF7141135.1 phage holin family protein [Pseudomonas sp. LY10J]NJO99669.1 phage holin family protein [Pseudomonas quercus]
MTLETRTTPSGTPLGQPGQVRLETTVHAPEGDVSVIGLLRQLTHEVPALFSKELALAKAEMEHNITTLKAGVAAVAGGAIVLLAGFIVLLMAAVYGLSTVLQPWAAALIVGGIVVVIGLVMVQAGKKQFEASNLRPDRTLDALDKDQQTLRSKMP